MTVSTLTGIPADVKRALDTQNKSSAQLREQKVATPATLPSDSVAETASAPLLSVAVATQQTIAQNREAAASTLSEADFDVLEQSESPQAQLLANAKAGIAAQTKRLPPSMLELLAE